MAARYADGDGTVPCTHFADEVTGLSDAINSLTDSCKNLMELYFESRANAVSVSSCLQG